MSQLSQTTVSPSRITGTRPWPEKAIASLSVNRQGSVSTARPLCASAIRVRQQYGLNRSAGSAPARSYSTIDIDPPSPPAGPTPRDEPRGTNPEGQTPRDKPQGTNRTACACPGRPTD